MRTASVTGVRAHLSAYLDQVQIEGPLVITRNGGPVGVLIAPVDNDDLEGLLLARSPRFQVLLEQSRESIRQGKGLSHEAGWGYSDKGTQPVNTRSLLISAGVGGLVMGVLSAMPVLSLANCLLCLWLWLGGGLAVFIYARMEQKPLSTGDGAIVGAAAGLVGAIVFSGLWLVLGAAALGVLSALGETTGDELVSLLAMGSVSIAIRFVFALVLGPAIGALAGLVGVELFGKAAPPTPLG